MRATDITKVTPISKFPACAVTEISPPQVTNIYPYIPTFHFNNKHIINICLRDKMKNVLSDILFVHQKVTHPSQEKFYKVHINITHSLI